MDIPEKQKTKIMLKLKADINRIAAVVLAIKQDTNLPK